MNVVVLEHLEYDSGDCFIINLAAINKLDPKQLVYEFIIKNAITLSRMNRDDDFELYDSLDFSVPDFLCYSYQHDDWGHLIATTPCVVDCVVHIWENSDNDYEVRGNEVYYIKRNGDEIKIADIKGEIK